MSESWRVDGDGWIAAAEKIPSPNFDPRPTDEAISLIVIHAISLPPGQFGGDGIAALFCNRLDPNQHPYYQTISTLKVSSHFLLRRDGHLVQFVSCDQRAWHAGVSRWKGRERCNDFSLGIELEGCDDVDFEGVQYQALNRLLAVLRARYPITDIAGHSDIAPARKTDPGPCFDWGRIALTSPR
jgi:AmpD protein